VGLVGTRWDGDYSLDRGFVLGKGEGLKWFYLLFRSGCVV